MRIVVLGSEGRLGAAVLECVRGAVVAKERLGLRYVTVEGLAHSDLDISNSLYLEGFLGSCGADTCIINCAALTNVVEIERAYLLGSTAALLTNATPLLHLARWCSVATNKSVIHMSTSYVFPGGTHTSECVNMETTIEGCYYGETKRIGELNLLMYGSNYTLIRLDNLYGGAGNSKVFLEKIVDQLVGTQQYLVVTDLQYTRPISSSLLALATAELAISRVTGTTGIEVLHPSYEYDHFTTYNEYAKLIAWRAGVSKPIYSEVDHEIPTGNVRRPNSVLIGNWIIGSSYEVGLRSAVRDYMKSADYNIKK
jgi:dTDP-4-dehydrorhamnose reductase